MFSVSLEGESAGVSLGVSACMAGESYSIAGESAGGGVVWCGVVYFQAVDSVYAWQSYLLPSIAKHQACGSLTPTDSSSLIFLFSLNKGVGGSRPIGAGHS